MRAQVDRYKREHSGQSPAELKPAMFSYIAHECTSAVIALEELGCPRPSEEDVRKYTILTDKCISLPIGQSHHEILLERNKIDGSEESWEARTAREEEESERELRRREESEKKYEILRKNSPKLNAEMIEARRRIDEASESYCAMKDKLWETHKAYKKSTDPYWRAGAIDYDFNRMLANNPDARHLDSVHDSRKRTLAGLEYLLKEQADKLSLDEAQKTSLDKQCE